MLSNLAGGWNAPHHEVRRTQHVNYVPASDVYDGFGLVSALVKQNASAGFVVAKEKFAVCESAVGEVYKTSTLTVITRNEAELLQEAENLVPTLERSRILPSIGLKVRVAVVDQYRSRREKDAQLIRDASVLVDTTEYKLRVALRESVMASDKYACIAQGYNSLRGPPSLEDLMHQADSQGYDSELDSIVLGVLNGTQISGAAIQSIVTYVERSLNSKGVKCFAKVAVTRLVEQHLLQHPPPKLCL